MVFRYSKRARTFFTKYVPSRSFGGHVTWNRRLAELLSGYETGHCGRPRSTGRGLRVHFKRETRALLFSLWPFSSQNHAPKGPERKRNKPRCCWPAIFASLLFSENEKGQRVHGLRPAGARSYMHTVLVTNNEPCQNLNGLELGIVWAVTFSTHCREQKKVFNLRGFCQVNSAWKKWTSTRCCNRLYNKKFHVFFDSLNAWNFLPCLSQQYM